MGGTASHGFSRTEERESRVWDLETLEPLHTLRQPAGRPLLGLERNKGEEWAAAGPDVVMSGRRPGGEEAEWGGMGAAVRDHGHGLHAGATPRRRDTTPRPAEAPDPPRPGRPARPGIGACAALAAQRADGAGPAARGRLAAAARVVSRTGRSVARRRRTGGIARRVRRLDSFSAPAAPSRAAAAPAAWQGARCCAAYGCWSVCGLAGTRLGAGAAWALCGTARDALRSAGPLEGLGKGSRRSRLRAGPFSSGA